MDLWQWTNLIRERLQLGQRSVLPSSLGLRSNMAGRLDHLLRRDDERVVLRWRVAADEDGVGVLTVAAVQQQLPAHERQHQDERDPENGENLA